MKNIKEICGQIYATIVAKIMPPRVNEQAIRNWQEWLDRTYPPGPWIPINTFNTMVEMKLDGTSNSGVVFDHNRGYPLKGFVNTSTGEVKVFDARRFYA